MGADDPVLTPPRGGGDMGDYSLRDFAMKWLVQQADLAEIGRYRAANQAFRSSDDGRRRVVFIGDSITEYFAVLDKLRGPDWIAVNRGIAGQNTTQLLLRFEDDVVGLSPAAVVLLGGTNDLRCYAGDPASIAASASARITCNVTAMADIAAARDIALLIGTLPPVGTQPGVYRDSAAIAAVNEWLAEFAETRGLPLIDYHAALADAAGNLPPALSEDGVHPLSAGYARMLVPLREALGTMGFHTM